MFITIRDISFAQLNTSQESTLKLNEEFHKAVDHAVESLSFDEDRHIFVSSEEAIAAFFNSLYASFDLFIDPDGKQRLQLFIPVIAVVDEDGVYFSYLQEEVKNNVTCLVRTWSNRIPYRYEENNKIYEFSLSKEAWCYDESNQLLEVIETKEEMEFIRVETIRNIIEENLINYMNYHNHIAKQYGIMYDFILPSLDNSFFTRSINEPTLIVLFQGYPLEGCDEVYNSAAFGGASLIKKEWFVLTKHEGYYLYHCQNCEKLETYQNEHQDEEQIICKDKEECASFGAFPCSNCFPSGKNYDFLGYIHMKN